jgi:tetratricopeptide (TPR) repeat protein
MHPAAQTDRGWSLLRLPSDRLRMAVAAALLVWSVAAAVLAVQTQTAAPSSPTVSPPGSAAGAEVYLKRGEDFTGVQQYDRAIADFTTAIQLQPDYAEAYNDRGFAYYLKGDVERAIADYTRAIDLRPDYPKAYNSRGVAYMAHGYGAAKSVPDFDRAIALKPDFRYAYINRANARLTSHPWLALQDFHRAGMYPERTVAILGGAVLIMIVGIVWIRRKSRRGDSGAA